VVSDIAGQGAFRLGGLDIAFEGGAAVVSGPAGVGEATEVEGSRACLREWTRSDGAGRYRPLAGARTMRRGWRARCLAAELPALLDEVYPLALRHREQLAMGTLRVVSIEDVLARQTGRYAVAAGLDDDGRRAASEALCSRCVKTPVWRGDTPDDGTVPCPEPCSVLVSLCREAALWQRERPATSDADLGIAFAAFDEPGNEVREAYLAARYEHG
jgi:sirohydrochlorin cobaltochelatase